MESVGQRSRYVIVVPFEDGNGRADRIALLWRTACTNYRPYPIENWIDESDLGLEGSFRRAGAALPQRHLRKVYVAGFVEKEAAEKFKERVMRDAQNCEIAFGGEVLFSQLHAEIPEPCRILAFSR